MRGLMAPLLAAGLLTAIAAPANAHPHVWVTTRAELIYGPDGRVTAIRNAWTFDESYSAYATQGLAENGRIDPAQARELARTNMESLADSAYFTTLRAGGAKQQFGEPQDAELGLDGKQLTLRFTLPLKAPVKAGRLLFDVSDPTFFVDFEMAPGEDAVRLVGAPEGCSVSIQRPSPDARPKAGDLSEASFEALVTADLGTKLANRVVTTCR